MDLLEGYVGLFLYHAVILPNLTYNDFTRSLHQLMYLIEEH